jgi:predicted phosphodiesterase
LILDIAEDRLAVVSDLHLGNPASQAGTTFRAFLDFVRREHLCLCINGDGFEMLQTRFRRLIREALPLLGQISRLRREGGRVWYVVGNHDIYMEHFLDEWLVTGVSPFLNVTSGGKRIRIEHGHLYDPIFSQRPDLYEALTRMAGRFLFLRSDVYRLWDVAAGKLDRRRRRSAEATDGGDRGSRPLPASRLRGAPPRFRRRDLRAHAPGGGGGAGERPLREQRLVGARRHLRPDRPRAHRAQGMDGRCTGAAQRGAVGLRAGQGWG